MNQTPFLRIHAGELATDTLTPAVAFHRLGLESSDAFMHSERLSVPIPTVVRLARFVRVPYRREVPLTRRAVLDRDAHTCAYCAGRADTIDHVRPRSRGGLHTWTNVVAACARCNHRKGDRLLSDIGWHLPTPPAAPPATVAVVMGWASRDPSWEPYLELHPPKVTVAPAV